MKALPIAQPLVENTRREAGESGSGQYSYYNDDQFEHERVSKRLPPRPRLRIEGMTKDGSPVDLVPVLDDGGNVVPDMWVAPLQRDGFGGWKTVRLTTRAVRERAKDEGFEVRILND